MVDTPSTSAPEFRDKILHYVLDTALCIGTASPAYQALAANGFETLADFMSLAPGDFDQIEYQAPSEDDATKMVIKHLTLGMKRHMRLFIQYAKELVNDPDAPLVLEAEWMLLTKKDFTAYRISFSNTLDNIHSHRTSHVTNDRIY